jgi:hypothetical protein
MKIVRQNTYKIEYKENGTSYNEYILIEADSFEEALNIFNEYNSKNTLSLLSISKYIPVLKSLTKTITVEI